MSPLRVKYLILFGLSENMGEIRKTINGEGEFCFIGYNINLKLKSPFILEQYKNGLIKINFSLNNRNKNWNHIGRLWDKATENNIVVEGSLKGKVYNPDGQITVKRFVIELVKTKPKKEHVTLDCDRKVEIIHRDCYQRKYTIEVGLTNLDFFGFIVELDEFDIIVTRIKDYSNIINQLREDKNAKLTAKAEIVCKKKRSLDISTEIKVITKLLSYALRTEINEIYEEYYYNGNLHKIILIPNRTKTFVSGRYLIHPYHGNYYDLGLFLKTTYLNYKRNYKTFGLDLAFDYYLDSMRSNIIQNKFILGMICLEVILGHYGDMREKTNNPIKKGIKARNKKDICKILSNEKEEVTEQTINKIVEKVSYPHLTLEEKLNEFLKEKVSMKLDKKDRELFQIRNKIVHTGMFPKSIVDGKKARKIDEIEEIYRLIYLNDRLILRILNYKRKIFYNILENFKTAFLDWKEKK